MTKIVGGQQTAEYLKEIQLKKKMFTQTQKKQKPTDECRSPFSKTTHTTIIKQNLLRFRFVFCCKQPSIKADMIIFTF